MAGQEKEGQGHPGEPPGPDSAAELPEAASMLPSVEEELARTREELERLSHQMVRLQADFENYRRRTRQETERAVDEAVERLARRILPVVDGLERALAAAPEPAAGEEARWLSLLTGIKMVHQDLVRALAAEGIDRIAADGEAFDPAVHQVVERVPVDRPDRDMRVVAELQPGYLLRGRVLRPSMVRVGVYQPPPVSADGGSHGDPPTGAAGPAAEGSAGALASESPAD